MNQQLVRLSQATLAQIDAAVKKSATGGINTTTGAAGIDLAPFVVLYPVVTPFYNSTPRRIVPQGANATRWQTFQNTQSLQSYGFTAADTASAVMEVEIGTQANAMTQVGTSTFVSLDALGLAENYVDVYALAVSEMVLQKLVKEDILMLNGLSFSIGSVSAPTVTASATGGTIPASTAVSVQVAARSGYNYFAGGSTAASAAASVTTGSTGSTNSVSATLANPPELAAAYDWFVNGYYYTTTVLPTVTVTSLPTTNQAVPNTPSLPLLYGAGTVAITSVPTTDTSYSATGYTGLIGSILADLSGQGSQTSPAYYVAPGTGTSQNAYKLNLAGGQLTADGPQIEQFNDALLSIYSTWQISPTRILLAPQQFNDISTAILGTVNAVNFFDPTSVAQHRGLVASGSVPIYVNPVTGEPIQLQVQPHLPPGQAVFVSDVIPFPGSNIASSVEVRCTYDNFLFQYGVTSSESGPAWNPEVRSQCTFVNYAAPTMGVLTGIAPGVAA